MGDNEKLYHQALKEYRNENQYTPNRLEKAVREKRYADAVQLVQQSYLCIL
jgi:hypothetical protein